jgi:hypothetical protein
MYNIDVEIVLCIVVLFAFSLFLLFGLIVISVLIAVNLNGMIMCKYCV